MERPNVEFSKFLPYRPDWRGLMFPATLSAVLILISFFNYLLFHTLAEFFAITVCAVMFVVAWHSHEFSRNHFLMFLACGYAWVGGMDLMHTITFPGMKLLESGGFNTTSQLWIATRYSEALILFAAPLLLTRTVERKTIFVIFGIIASTLCALVLMDVFPQTFIVGKGLTPFKINSEYAIVALLAGAAIHLTYRRLLLNPYIFKLLIFSIVLTMSAELAFTFYVSMYGLSNLAGHIFKLFSFWLIFQAIVATNLKKPYQELNDTKERAEQGRKEVERQKNLFEGIFNGITDAIVMTDTERKIISVNPGMKRIFGYDMTDLAGKTTRTLYESEEEYERQGKLRFNLSEKDKLESYAVKYRRKDGCVFPGETLGRIVKGDDGNVLGFLGVIRDITTRQAAEDEIHKLSRAIEQSPASVLIADTQGNIEYVNPKFEQLTGYTLKEVIGKNPRILKSGHTSPEEYERLWNTITTGGEWRGELRNKKKNGELYWESASISAIKSADGEITNFLAVKEDITAQKQAEKLSSRFGRIIEESLNEIYIFDAETLSFIQANRGALRNLGYSLEELKEITPIDIKPEYSLREFKELVRPLREGSKERFNFETLHQRKNGTTYEVSIYLQLIESETPPVFAAIVEDITERKSAERALRGSEELKGAILDGAHAGVVTIDHDGKVVEFNKAGEKIFGYSRLQALGKNVADLIIPPEYRQKHLDGLKQFRISGKSNIIEKPTQITAMRASGEEFPCELIVTHQDSLNLFTAFIRDLTEEKEMEETLRRAQKMDAVGQMVGGIAHDFNNILSIVMGNLEIVKRMVGDDAKPADRIKTAMKGAKRGADLTRRLLGFSRQVPTQLEETNISNVIEEMYNLLDRSLTQTIVIESDLDENLWRTEINPADFEDAVINLALNAKDAMPHGGALTIRTENVHFDGRANQPPNITKGDYVQLTVSDTGVGMSSEVREKAFDPFFSTKEQGKGTGLGLSMVYGFVNRSGGHIKIDSEPDKGTTFEILLPRAMGAAEGNKREPLEDPATPHGNETLLVVDDEEELLDLAVHRLERIGYTVFMASNAADALAILDAGEHVELMISDIVMPGGMNGYDLAEVVLKKYPDIRILLTSGYAAVDNVKAQKDHPRIKRLSDNLLDKPYTEIALARKVREILDA